MITRSTAKLCLCFDTETTSLYPSEILSYSSEIYNGKRNRNVQSLLDEEPKYPIRFKNEIQIDSHPHITQLSFVLYDATNNRVVQVFNEYIKLPKNVKIHEKAQEITGITWDICNEKGISIIDALLAFQEAYFRASIIVAHNIEFDMNIIHSNIIKYKTELCNIVPYIISVCNPEYDCNIMSMERFCTMIRTIRICNIQVPKKDGSGYKIKLPKLVELYAFLFGKENVPSNLHNSIIDTLICLRCFMRIRFRKEIDESQFKKIIRLVSSTNRNQEMEGYDVLLNEPFETDNCFAPW